MRVPQKNIFILINLLATVLIFLNLKIVGLPGASLVLFLLWWTTGSLLASQILQVIFSTKSKIVLVLGYGLTIFLLGFAANIFTSWLILNYVTLGLSFIIVGLILYGSHLFLVQGDAATLAESMEEKNNTVKGRILWGIFFFIFLVLSVVGWIMLYASRTGDYIKSPWQVINPWFVAVVFILSVLVFTLIFLSKRRHLTLAIIIIFSFLVHSYLLVYTVGFGGDRWRHLGSEYRILHTMAESPKSYGDIFWSGKLAQIGSVSFPARIINGSELSYGLGWSLSAIFSLMSGIDVFYLDQYLGIFLGSIWLPIIFFIGAGQIKKDRRFMALAAAMPLIFYVVGYYGSLALPASLGASYIVFLICLWLAYLNNSRRKVAWFIIFLTALLYFSYILSLLVAVLLMLIVFAVKRRGWLKYLSIALSACLLFVVELLSAYSFWQWKAFNLKFLLNAFRTNILYFHPQGFVPFLYVHFSKMYVALEVVFLAVLLYLLIKAVRQKNDQLKFIFWLIAVLFLNYLLIYYFLSGLVLIGHRLDIYMAMPIIILLAWGINEFVRNKKRALAVAVILSIVFIVTYTSGSYQEAALTSSDVSAMKYAYLQTNDNPLEYCALANTWPLLALEAYSYREIGLGNFPSDYNHGQLERVALYDLANKDLNWQVLSQSLAVSKKKKCFLLLNRQTASAKSVNWARQNLGQENVFGDNLLWRFDEVMVEKGMK